MSTQASTQPSGQTTQFGWATKNWGLLLAIAALGATLLLPAGQLAISVSLFAILCLALLGAVGAGAGGAPIGKAVLRVTFWGALALLATAAIGRLFGAVV